VRRTNFDNSISPGDSSAQRDNAARLMRRIPRKAVVRRTNSDKSISPGNSSAQRDNTSPEGLNFSAKPVDLHHIHSPEVRMKRILLPLFLLVYLCACTAQTPAPLQATDTPAATEVPIPTPTPVPPRLRVAYSKNADPWIWTEGEGPRQLADSVNVMDVRLSSDGMVVAFKRDDTGELLAVNADGTGLHTLVSADFLAGQNASIWKFSFAPASHTVYFTLVPASGDFAPFYDLHRVDASARTPTVELVLEAGEGGIPTFSPDGQWMTIYHPGAFNLVRTDGSEERAIFSYPEGYEPATFGPEVVWRADSSGFSFYRDSEVVFVPLVGDPVVSPTIASLWGVVSPDGQSVAYTTPDGEVHIVSPDGTDTLYTTAQNISFGSWLPDSKHFTLVYDVIRAGYNYQVNEYFIGAVGEEPTRLTDTDDTSCVTWLSNNQFLFVGVGDLRLQTLGQPSSVLDGNIYNSFEYAWVMP